MRLRMNDVILRLASRRRSPLGCGLPVLSDDLHLVASSSYERAPEFFRSIDGAPRRSVWNLPV